MLVLPEDTDIPPVPANMGFEGSGNPDRRTEIKRSYREETKGSSNNQHHLAKSYRDSG